MYEYTVQVRRLDTAQWLPLACNTEEEAYATAQFAIGPAGSYHIARVAKRLNHDSQVFRVVETLDIRDRYVGTE